MKIFDETGSPIENPDLSKGWLESTTQTVHHDAVEGVEEVTHYEYKEYPNGGRDRITVVDVPGVAAQVAYDETVEVQVYHPYTAEELAAQEEARKKAEEEAKQRAQKQAALDALPDTVAALKAQQADTDSLLVEQEYRLTLMELGVDETETA